MGKSNTLLVFALDEQRYALFLDAVERVIRVVEVTPLPKAPEMVLGAINMQGRIIPVMNLRKRFRLPEQEFNLNNHLIIARTPKRDVAIVADNVAGVYNYPDENLIEKGRILPEMEYVEGVVKLDDGMILIHNLNKFLSLDEEVLLDKAIG